jgi:hypothetical protein
MIQQRAFDFLFVLPFGLAAGFMVWVFWSLHKQIKR